MSEPLTIDRNNKLLPSEDYHFLRKEGIRLIQNLSGKVWTDYNTHDPGITLLEAFCYTLTDLAYRTSFDIKDILTPEKLSVSAWEKIFYTAREILPCNPVTLNDFRKLIIDTEGVRNAWIEISNDCEVPMYLQKEQKNENTGLSYTLTYDETQGDRPLRLKGLYKIFVEYENEVLERKKEAVVANVIKNKLSFHRNLCEDFLSVTSIEYELFKIEADVQVSEGTDIEKINAQIYEVIQSFFSPPITFYTLEQMIAKGYSTEEIFEGPVLKYGFIDTKELEKSERYKSIHLSDIMSLITNIEGVIAIKKFALPLESKTPLSDFTEWINHVKDEQKAPRLDIANSVVNFFRSGDRHREKDGNKTRPNLDRVKAIYSFLQSANFKSRLKGLSKDLTVPAGEYMNIAEYFPLQNTLPAAYGMVESYVDDKVNENAILAAIEEIIAEKIHRIIRDKINTSCTDIERETQNIKYARQDVESKVNGVIKTFIIELSEENNSKAFAIKRLDEILFKKVEKNIYDSILQMLNANVDEHTPYEITNLLSSKVDQTVKDMVIDLVKSISDIEGVKSTVRSLLDEAMDINGFKKVADKLLIKNNRDPALREKIRDLLLKNLDGEKLFKLLHKAINKREHYNSQVSDKTKTLNELSLKTFGKSLLYLSGDAEVNNIKNQFIKHQINGLEKNKKQTLQLKGFLMVFEQILADYLSHLSNIRELFSFNSSVKQTYYPQVLQEVRNMELLFVDFNKYKRSLNNLSETEGQYLERRNIILDHLMGRFAESMEKYSFFLKAASGNAARKKLVEDKINFLSDYIQISNYRGKGFQYRSFSDAEVYNKLNDSVQTWDTDNVEGMKKRICRMLGLNSSSSKKNYSRRFIASDSISIQKIEVNKDIVRYVVILTDPDDNKNVLIKSEMYDLESEALGILNYILENGFNPELYEKEGGKGKWNYQLKKWTRENDYEVVASRSFDDKDLFDNKEEAEAAFTKLIKTLAAFSEEENFHIIEHILLRPKIGIRDKTSKKGGAINTDMVELLSVEDVWVKEEVSESSKEEKNYSFKIKSKTDQSEKEKTLWKLSLLRYDRSEVLSVEEDFDFYKHLTRRIEKIRQFASDRSNYLITPLKDELYIFSIVEGDRQLAISTKKYRVKEEIEAEISNLVKFFSYENESVPDEDENINDLTSIVDPYSFQISIFIPAWTQKFRNPTFKHLLEKTIFIETPSHIYPHVYWLNHNEMKEFEEAYKLWLGELANEDIPNTEVVNNLMMVLNRWRKNF